MTRLAMSISRHHFNPLPPRGGRPVTVVLIESHALISTHSLLAEGDDEPEVHDVVDLLISTHSLLAEGDVAAFMAAL